MFDSKTNLSSILSLLTVSLSNFSFGFHFSLFLVQELSLKVSEMRQDGWESNEKRKKQEEREKLEGEEKQKLKNNWVNKR